MPDSKTEAKRGRAYRCPECSWTGEKFQSVTHYVKKHCVLAEAPFACPLCKFKGGTEDQLKGHAKSKWHRKRISEAELSDGDVLKRRKNGAMILEKFHVLPLAESQRIWNERSEKQGTSTDGKPTNKEKSEEKIEEPTEAKTTPLPIKVSPRKRTASRLSSSGSSSSSSSSSISSSDSSITLTSEKKSEKPPVSEPPSKKPRKTPIPEDSGTEGQFIPDFSESIPSKADQHPTANHQNLSTNNTGKPNVTDNKTVPNPSLEKVLKELTIQLAAKENDHQLIATATHGMTKQMATTNDAINYLNNRLTHLVDTLAKKNTSTPDSYSSSTGLKHLMGDVRAELRVLNQVLNQQTTYLGELHTTMREHTTAIKQQTARLEASATNTSASLDTFSKCFTSHLALLERLIRNRPSSSDAPTEAEERPRSPRRRPNTFRGFHPRRPYHSYSMHRHNRAPRL